MADTETITWLLVNHRSVLWTGTFFAHVDFKSKRHDVLKVNIIIGQTGQVK